MNAHDYMLEAIEEFKELRHKIKPLVAILLLTDYTTEELVHDIKKIDSATMGRIGARLNNAQYLLLQHKDDLFRLVMEEREKPKPKEEYYTIKEFAEKTKSSVSHIRNLINNNLIPYDNFAGKGSINKLVRISSKTLEEYQRHQD